MAKNNVTNINKKLLILSAVIPVTAVLLIILLYRIKGIMIGGGRCIFLYVTGYLCPGCGNTRALYSLLQFDIPTSLQYNPIIFILAVFVILAYLELVFKAFKKQIKIIPRSKVLYISLSGLLIIYYILRNVPYFSWLSICR